MKKLFLLIILALFSHNTSECRLDESARKIIRNIFAILLDGYLIFQATQSPSTSSDATKTAAVIDVIQRVEDILMNVSHERSCRSMHLSLEQKETHFDKELLLTTLEKLLENKECLKAILEISQENLIAKKEFFEQNN
jgi:hypothetical protein